MRCAIGGVCNDTVWNGRSIPGTAAWQAALLTFLNGRGVSWFFWTLNDNSFSTGSLFNDYTGHSAEKLQMLSLSPTTLNAELEAEWARILVTPIAPPVPSLPPAVPPACLTRTS